jgi:hypothetical protein
MLPEVTFRNCDVTASEYTKPGFPSADADACSVSLSTMTMESAGA